MGTGSFLGVKWPGRGAEVMNEYSYTSTPLWAFGPVMGYLYLTVHIEQLVRGSLVVLMLNRHSDAYSSHNSDGEEEAQRGGD
jgi:hypothetical protein